jgi:hypothetical protein
MLRIGNPMTTPSGGWRFKIPELSGPAAEVGPCTCRYDLQCETRQRYAANAIMPPPDLDDQIDRQMCGRVPADCREDPPPPPSFIQRVAQALTHVAQGTNVFVQWQTMRLLGERVRVTQGQAEARAAICADCENNVPVSDCYTCKAGQLAALVMNISGGEKTRHHDSIGGCKVCGCGLQGKVWMEKSILRRNLPQANWPHYPPHCWLLRDEIPQTKHQHDKHYE